MFDMLVFAIEAKDEDTVLKLLKIIPKGLLFYNDHWRNFWISMLKHYECKRALDYIHSTAPEELKKAVSIPIKKMDLPLEPVTNPYDKKWNEIYKASQQQAPFETFSAKLAEYQSLITKQDNVAAIHFLRAAHIAFSLQDFPSATSLLEECVSVMRNNDAKVTPAILVDEALTEMTFRLFDALKVTLPEKYTIYFKNNLFNLSPSFSNCHEVFLFPLSTTVNLETLKAASQALVEFGKFKRTLTITERDYKADASYQQDVKERLFYIKLFLDWMDKIEKQNGLSVTFTGQDDLDKTIAGMKDIKLVSVLLFFDLKILMLNMAQQLYTMLDAAEYPYQVQLDHARAVNEAAIKRNNANFFAIMQESPTTQVGVSVKKSDKKKAKKGKEQKEKKESQPEKKLEDYKELPTYYPEELRPPVSVSSITQRHLSLFGAKQAVISPLSAESKKVSDKTKTLTVNSLKERKLAKNKRFPDEVYAIFRAFPPKQLFMTGVPVCDLLEGHQGNYFKFATILQQDELFKLVKRHVAVTPGASVTHESSGNFPAIQVSYGAHRYLFYSIKLMQGDSVHSALTRDAHRQFFTIKGNYIWIENDKEKMLDMVEGATHLRRNRRLELSDPSLKIDCFVVHPEHYLEALYLGYKYKLKLSHKMLMALNHVQPLAGSLLYQVDEKILRTQYSLFVRDFGKTMASEIFIKYGVFKTLIDRGILPVADSLTPAEKDVAPTQFRS